MLIERGFKVMNVDIVGDACAIVSNYLRKTGAIPDIIATDERVLEIVVGLFHRGERNRIRLANQAIARFESEFV
jgi:predicted transcriptional regulator